MYWCIWLCKDTNLKANHNISSFNDGWKFGVYDSAKILIWKQITTWVSMVGMQRRCIWLCKDTNLKANHNTSFLSPWHSRGVYDSAKILIWKQITTCRQTTLHVWWCIWLCKDTNLKANHNNPIITNNHGQGVYDSAKILIWKQITTPHRTRTAGLAVYMTLQRY